jgi:hypothetical protein
MVLSPVSVSAMVARLRSLYGQLVRSPVKVLPSTTTSVEVTRLFSPISFHIGAPDPPNCSQILLTNACRLRTGLAVPSVRLAGAAALASVDMTHDRALWL